jgi:putative membrane protein
VVGAIAPGAFFFAAGFFAFGFVVAGRGFFFGSADADSTGSAFFSGSIFGFLGTRDRNPVGSGLQADSAKRLREERNFAYRAAMRHFVFRWLVTTVGVMVAAAFINGIRYDTTGALIGAALLLGILNAFVRPVLLILGAPLILLTLGIFILIINGLMLYWVPSIVSGFHVDGFGSAFWGAILIGIISWLLSAFFRGSDGQVHVLTHHTQIKRVQGRVIEPGNERE